MDPYQVWKEDYRREVDQVLSALRAAKGKAAPVTPGLTENIIPPAAVYRQLDAAREELARLEPALNELRGQLDLRSERLAEEMRRRAQLKDLVLKMTAHVRALERESAAQGLKHREETSRAAVLKDKLAEAEREAARLAAQFEEEKRRVHKTTAELRGLQGRVDDLQLALDAKTHALKALQTRYEALAQNANRQTEGQEERVLELSSRLEEAQAKVEELTGQLKTEQSVHAEVSQRAEEARRRLLLDMADMRGELANALSQAKKEAEARARETAALSVELEGVKSSLTQEASRRMELELQLKSEQARLKEAVEQSGAAQAAYSRQREDARRAEAQREAELLEQTQAVQRERVELRAEASAARAEASAARAETDQAIHRAAAGAVEDERAFKAEVLRNLDEERRALRAEFESERSRLHGELEQARAALDQEAKLDQQAEEEKLARGRRFAEQLAEERERLRAEKEEERRRIMRETEADLAKAQETLRRAKEGL